MVFINTAIALGLDKYLVSLAIRLVPTCICIYLISKSNKEYYVKFMGLGKIED